MPLKLYAPPDNLRAKKILIAAKFSGAEIEQTPDFVIGRDNLTPEFLEKNPNGKVPVLETEEGCVWESNAIMRYVARLDENTHLLGANEYEKSLIDQWIDFSTGEIELPGRVWLLPIVGLMDNNPTATGKAKADIRKVLGILNEHLADRTFIVGERITLADIVLATTFVPLFKRVLDPGFRSSFVNVMRWFNTLVNQPNVKEVIGEVELCTKMQVAKGVEGAEKPARQPKEKQEKQEKQEKPKKEKKQEKKQEKKPKMEEEEEDEFHEKPEKKGSNPLDSLPPSSLVMDEWKRTYSNNDPNVSVPWLWEHFDKEGYSLYFSEYLYNRELDIDQIFKTCNLIGGWFQRLDKLRKYGFGSVVVLENANNGHEIAGVWLFRGQDVPAECRECDDYILHKWTKVDLSNPTDKKKAEEYFSWSGDFDGKKFTGQGKVFK